jgi:hypothetical protein
MALEVWRKEELRVLLIAPGLVEHGPDIVQERVVEIVPAPSPTRTST